MIEKGEVENENTIGAGTGTRARAARHDGQVGGGMIVAVDREGVVFDRRWYDEILIFGMEWLV